MQRKWYAIFAFPGYEHRVRAALLRKIREKKMESFFGEVIVPTEKIVEIVHGQKRIVEQRMFPGYLLAQVDLTDEVWHLIRSIPKVRGLVGKGQSATALSDIEVQGILDRMEAAAAKPRRKTSFTVGETVKIVDGPFKGLHRDCRGVRTGKVTAQGTHKCFRPTHPCGARLGSRRGRIEQRKRTMSFNFDAEKNAKELLQTDEVKLDEFEEKELELEPALTLSEEAEEEPDSEREEAGGTRDPISTYLRDIGSVPLLNREREVELAIDIERRKNQILDGLFSTPVALWQVLELGDALASGGTRYTRSRREIRLRRRR